MGQCPAAFAVRCRPRSDSPMRACIRGAHSASVTDQCGGQGTVVRPQSVQAYRRTFSRAATVRIQPRQNILDVWRSVVAASFRDGFWTWGGRDASNSISDAEQLLCLLYPAAEIESLALDRPDEMADDVRSVLRPQRVDSQGDRRRPGRLHDQVHH